MASNIKCPNPKWFLRLAAGQVTEEQEQKLSKHLERCKNCQAEIEKLNDLSEFVGETAREESNITLSSDSDRLNKQLQAIKEDSPVDNPKIQSGTVSSGYMDVMPWIESAEDCLGQVDEFKLLEFIGRGGMGVVFKCLDTKLQRLVAVKLMAPQLLVDELASERFLREARSAAKINHQNIVMVHSVNAVNGLPYLVMELIEGESLESRLAQKSLDFDEIVRITTATFAGLSAAHQKGVLHRDIKPGNIMLDRQNGQIKITDFGLAVSFEGTKLTRTGLLVGTPEYLSPEQAMGGTLDERSDLFSVGAVVYAMCSGSSPFSSSSVVTTLDKVRKEYPRPVSEAAPKIPRWFGAIVDRLLQKDPKRRFGSANEVLRALGQKDRIDQLEVIPPLNLPEQRTKTWARRASNSWWIQIAIAIVASVVFLATVLTAVWLANSKPSENGSETSALKGNEEPLLVTVRTFSELREAVEAPNDTIRIAIAPDSEIELKDSLFIEGKQVSIAAPENEIAKLFVEFRKEPTISIEHGSLRLENLELTSRVEFDESAEDEHAMIHSFNSTLEVVRCRILCTDERSCIELDESSGRITDSHIIGTDSAFHWHPANPGNELTLTNSYVLAPVVIYTAAEGVSAIIFNRSTLLAEFGIIMDLETFTSSKFRLEASNSVFHLLEGMIALEDIEETSDFPNSLELVEQIELRGSGNYLPRNFIRAEGEDSDLEIATNKLKSVRDKNKLIAQESFEKFDYDFFLENIQEVEFEFLQQIAEEYESAGADYRTSGSKER